MPPEAEFDREWLWIWRAWHRLSADRPQHGGGMGPVIPGPIPWSVVLLWAQHHSLTKNEFYLLDQCFQQMDATYNRWATDRRLAGGTDAKSDRQR